MDKKKSFTELAEKFRTERSKAWQEFLEDSAAAGYTIEDNLVNRSLFMGGYESGKEGKAAARKDAVREFVERAKEQMDKLMPDRNHEFDDCLQYAAEMEAE